MKLYPATALWFKVIVPYDEENSCLVTAQNIVEAEYRGDLDCWPIGVYCGCSQISVGIARERLRPLTRAARDLLTITRKVTVDTTGANR